MTCQDDYLNAKWSWEQVLQSHLRKPDQAKTPINVVYGPGNGKHDAHAAVSRQMKLLETVAEFIVGPLCLARADLARDADLRRVECALRVSDQEGNRLLRAGRRIFRSLSPVRTLDVALARREGIGSNARSRERRAIGEQPFGRRESAQPKDFPHGGAVR